jgi:hypothetical protein
MLGFILHFLKIMPNSDGMYYSIAPLAALAIGTGVKALTGIGQMLFSGKKQKEPKYEMPTKQLEAENLARGMAAKGMPEAQRMAALQNIQQSAVQAGRNIASLGRGSALAGQGNVQAQQDRSVLGLAAQDAAARMQNQRFLYSALMAGAQYQDKAFANEFQSYMNKEQQRRSLIGAGIQNIAGAGDTFLGGYLQNQYTQALSGTGGATDNILGRTIFMG